MFDLISIGDCGIDTFVPIENAAVVSADGIRMLAFPYGRKVPVGQSKSMVAGNAANNAVGSSRLKLKTAIYTNVGNLDDDEADDRIKERLKKEGVDIRYVVENADLPSNHYIILEYKGERTILVHHQPWKFHLPDLDKTKWIYLPSLSPSHTKSNLIEQIINYIERSRCKMAYQPGTFQIKQGVKKQARLLSLCEIITLNMEEAKMFLGHEPEDNIPVKKLLKGMADLGTKKAVITDGGEGSYGYDGERFFKLEIFPAKMLQMTGAGDAYSTACVAGLFYGKSLEEAMRWGAANGASVVEQIGTQTGLLTYGHMSEKLKENKDIISKEI